VERKKRMGKKRMLRDKICKEYLEEHIYEFNKTSVLIKNFSLFESNLGVLKIEDGTEREMNSLTTPVKELHESTPITNKKDQSGRNSQDKGRRRRGVCVIK
jgi:hypothetical protein